MKSQFGKTKEYLFGKLTDTKAGEIRVVRFFGRAVYEKVGSDQRVFGFTADSPTFAEDIITKLLATVIMFVVMPILFVFLFCSFIYIIWKPNKS